METRIVDAHVHVVSPDEERYPRRTDGRGGSWWDGQYGSDELIADLDASGVHRAVVVQAVSPYGYDCRAAIDATAGDDRLALVGAVDMAGDDVEGAFDALGRSTDLAGLRLFGVSSAGTGWLTDGRGAAVWQRAAEIGCVLVPTLFADALPALRTLVEEHPDVDVALDHCAFPDLGGSDAMARLIALADLPRLHLKVTSHNLASVDDPATFVDAVVDAYGAHRVCWGSDHPQHRANTYAQKLDDARLASRNLPPSARASFLGTTATRLWWPDAGAPHAVSGSEVSRDGAAQAR